MHHPSCWSDHVQRTLERIAHGAVFATNDARFQPIGTACPTKRAAPHGVPLVPGLPFRPAAAAGGACGPAAGGACRAGFGAGSGVGGLAAGGSAAAAIAIAAHEPAVARIGMAGPPRGGPVAWIGPHRAPVPARDPLRWAGAGGVPPAPRRQANIVRIGNMYAGVMDAVAERPPPAMAMRPAAATGVLKTIAQ